ncbi:MAG TPA: phosphotransferase, partial [Acidimicrobiales bacterium]|nr:phosphotransferase [Acidimicrobiales bacterium]
VLRSPAPQSSTVIALLRHLRSEGCDFVPEPVDGGFAPDGRERLGFIEGETAQGVQWDDESLWRIGTMLRQVHDASASFAPSQPVWRDMFLRTLPGGRRVIAHGDLGPWNILARDGEPVAFIDWDDAGPAGHMWDLVNVVWLNAQLHDDDVAELHGLPPRHERARGARLVLDGYELPAAERAGFVDCMIEFAVRSARDEAIVCGVTPTTVSPGDDGFPTLWAITWRARAAAWMYDHRVELERIIER